MSVTGFQHLRPSKTNHAIDSGATKTDLRQVGTSERDFAESFRPNCVADQEGRHLCAAGGGFGADRESPIFTLINGCVNGSPIPVLRCAFPGDRGKRKRVMTKDDLRKGQRIIPRNPKTGTEVPASRVVVFKASANLNRRINRHSPVTMRDRLASGH